MRWRLIIAEMIVIYGVCVALNLILDKFGYLHGWRLAIPDFGVGVIAAVWLQVLARRRPWTERDARDDADRA